MEANKDYTKELSFWKRLKVFVSNVQTGCCAGEEEKQMLLNVATQKINNTTTMVGMLEAGKNYKLKHPNGAGDTDLLHIDYILDNPIDDIWWSKLVVCRYWGKHKRRWFYYTYPYFTLAIYNDWNYGN